MADGKKKKSEKKKTAAAASTAPLSAEVAAVEAGQLHSPWLPLIWIIVPLLACVIYGILTRSQGR